MQIFDQHTIIHNTQPHMLHHHMDIVLGSTRRRSVNWSIRSNRQNGESQLLNDTVCPLIFWCRERDLNPHGLPFDFKSNASTLPPSRPTPIAGALNIEKNPAGVAGSILVVEVGGVEPPSKSSFSVRLRVYPTV